MKKEEQILGKLFFGTLLYGVIINFVILIVLDNFNKSEECLIGSPMEAPCTIYPFLLLISIALGWLVSIIMHKIDNYNNYRK